VTLRASSDPACCVLAVPVACARVLCASWPRPGWKAFGAESRNDDLPNRPFRLQRGLPRGQTVELATGRNEDLGQAVAVDVGHDRRAEVDRFDQRSESDRCRGRRFPQDHRHPRRQPGGRRDAEGSPVRPGERLKQGARKDAYATAKTSSPIRWLPRRSSGPRSRPTRFTPARWQIRGDATSSRKSGSPTRGRR
jgi:hypothetical protein